jgi:geranylgeranyl diphosphate synthase type II
MSMNVSVTLASDGLATLHAPPQTGSDSLSNKQSLIESALKAASEFPLECPRRLQEAIRYSLLTPGKRLRPMLVMLAAEACGGTAEHAVPAACAVEMIHTYSLIHDDLPSMDDDDMRRGRPTLHKVFGEGIAILAGDALLALAFEMLARDIRPAEVAAACCATLAKASGATALVGGQCDDISQEVASGSRDLLDSIHNRKTGALFLASLRLGALVAGATEVQLRALHEFGSHLGLAFQITDDLLDHAGGRTAKPGKRRRGSDAGKLTFPNLIGLESSRTEVARLIICACDALAPFGSSARSLKALANFVSDRAGNSI